MIAVVKQFIGYLRDRFNSTRNIYPYGMIFIKAAQQIESGHPAGHVIIHGNLLPDDTLLFFHRFFCKIRVGHKIKEDLKAVCKPV